MTRRGSAFFCFILIVASALGASIGQRPDLPWLSVERLREAALEEEGLVARVRSADSITGFVWLESANLSVEGVLQDGGLFFKSGARAGDLVRVSVGQGNGELVFDRVEGDSEPESLASLPDLERSGYVDLLAYIPTQSSGFPETPRLTAIAEGRYFAIERLYPPESGAVDAEGKFVRAKGFLEVNRDGPSGRIERTLWLFGEADFEVLEEETENWFKDGPWGVPVLHQRREGERVRAVGRLVPSKQPNRVFLEDSAGRTEIATEQAKTMKMGVPVELVFTARSSELNNVGNPVLRPLALQSIGDSAGGSAAVEPSRFKLIREVFAEKQALVSEQTRFGITGSVTLIGRYSRFAVLQDASGVLRVLLPPEFGRRVSTSDFLYLEGELGKDGSIDALVVDRFARLGKRPMPQAAVLDLKRASMDAVFQNRVAVEGYVEGIRVTRNGSEIDLVRPDGELAVWVRTVFSDGYRSLLLGSVSRFTGISLGKRGFGEGDPRLLLGVASGRHIERLERKKDDPFRQGPSTYDQILEQCERGGQLGLARMSGEVLHSDGNRRLVLSDGRASLDVLLPKAGEANIGDWLDVIGLPGEVSGSPVLRVVYQRRDESRAPIVAEDLRLDSKALREQDTAFVKFEGEVLSIHEDDRAVRFILSDGEHNAGVFLAVEGRAETDFPFKERDTIEAVGILRVLEDPISGLTMANIVLRDADDLTLVRAGPFWTARRLMYLIVLSFLAVCCAYLWIFYLRLKVDTKELELERQRSRTDMIAENNRRIMDQASDFMFTVDLEGRLTNFNAAGARLTGFTREEALSMTLFDLLDRREAMAAYLALSRKHSLGHLKHFKVRFKRKDGSRIWLQVSPSLIEEAGEVKGGLVIARDVTREVEERESLERAKALAEANADAKARFLATMSHELRTPMNGMIGMMNLLLDTKLNSEQIDCVKTVLSSSQALHGILSAILDYSKLESGAMLAEKLRFDPRAVIGEAFKLMSASAVSKSLAVSFEGAETLPDRVVGDSGRLRQIIVNLLGNAIKFTERGSVGLKVGVSSESENQVEVLFEVLDTGIGVDEDKIEGLFTAFQQADNSHSRRFGGTGLGLTISRQLVELLGGEIGAESKKGVGSRFWFRLPLELDGGGISGDSQIAEKGKKSGKGWTGPDLKILVAEDNPVNQKLMKMQLKKIGLQADLAEDGEQAVEAVERICYDLILMDCQMPNLDGWEATRLIRQSERNKRIAIIAVTANISDEDQAHCKEVGMNGFVGKPTNPKKLLSEIKRVLSGSTSSVESSASS